MKKAIYLALVTIASMTLSANSAELTKLQQANIFCDLFGIDCPIIVTSDGNGDGKEPPKREI